MKILTAKEMFEAGALLSVTITESPIEGGWRMDLERMDRNLVTLMTERNTVRIFKTVETAFSTAKDIGFKSATLNAAP